MVRILYVPCATLSLSKGLRLLCNAKSRFDSCILGPNLILGSNCWAYMAQCSQSQSQSIITHSGLHLWIIESGFPVQQPLPACVQSNCEVRQLVCTGQLIYCKDEHCLSAETCPADANSAKTMYRSSDRHLFARPQLQLQQLTACKNRKHRTSGNPSAVVGVQHARRMSPGIRFGNIYIYKVCICVRHRYYWLLRAA